MPFERLCVAAAIVVLAGCGSGAGEDVAPSPVAARVNNSEITTRQVVTMVEQNASSPNGNGPTERAALERLIDQELMVQQALRRNLDRDPAVVRQVEALKRDVLVRAYLEGVVAGAQAPGDGEVEAFYADNPALFAERRIYKFQEVTVPLQEDSFAQLEAAVAGARSMDDVAQWLSRHELVFDVKNVVRAAEQLPLERLDVFSAMTDGQVVLARTAEGARMVHLASSRAAPLDLAEARPFIEEYLLNRRKSEVAREALARLRTSARISYVGDFARESGQDDAGSDATAADHAGARPVAEARWRSAMERGVAGLR